MKVRSLALTLPMGFAAALMATIALADPIKINTLVDLQNMNNNLSGDYQLATDIDASVTAVWNGGTGFIPIGRNTRPFVGTFDGQGHTITNLVSSSTIFYSGLFGNVGSSGVVRNIGVTNATIKTGLIPGLGGGILAGENEGTIEDAFATGTIDGGTYGSNVGGLVGTNSGQVIKSFANVAVSGKGIYSFGGLVGDNAGTGTITQSYAAGSVYGGNANGGLVGLNLGKVSQSYATGRITGRFAVGGLVGNAQGTTTTSYWDIQTTGQSQSAGGTPLTTADLQSGVLPAGFQPTIWVPIEAEYPELQWRLFSRPAYPVVFVHGLCSTADIWSDLEKKLPADWKYGGTLGVIGNPNSAHRTDDAQKADYYTITFSDPAIRSGIREWATELANFLEDIKQIREDERAKFIIVAHSAGGLAARAYLQIYHNNDIVDLITYGTPHGGTKLAGNLIVLAFFQP